MGQENPISVEAIKSISEISDSVESLLESATEEKELTETDSRKLIHTTRREAQERDIGEERMIGQTPNQQNPVETIVGVYRNRLPKDPSINKVLVDSTPETRELSIYVVLDDEKLDIRLDVMDVTNRVMQIHPEWNITARVIAIETDPELSQVPRSAKSIDQISSDSRLPEYGHAF